MEGRLWDLEDQAWQANLAGDANFYARILRDDALAVAGHGVAEKAAMLDTFRRNDLPFSSYKITDRRTVVVSDRTVILVYRVHVEVAGRTDAGFDSYVSTVYRCSSDQWQIVLHQHSAVMGDSTASGQA